MTKPQPDITGKTFSYLVVRYKNEDGSWHCACKCGNTSNVRGYRLRNGSTKSCGCRRKDAAKTRKGTLYPGQASANAVYRSYMESADKRDLSFELPSEMFFDLVKQNCHYCGVAPSNLRKGGNGDFHFNGLDRLDNSVGYELDNVVPCCFICNRAKGTIDEAAFLEWLDRIVARKRKKVAVSGRRKYLIPVAPASLNQAYSTRILRKGKKSFPMRYLQPGHRAFKDYIKKTMAQTDEECGGPLDFEPPFAINFLFLMERASFFFKNGNVRRCDVSDYIKLVEDACSEHWGIDDCHNFLLVAHKRWVDELPEFVEDAYKSPPHKTLRAIIKIVVTPIPDSFAEWDGHVVPDTSILRG